MTRPGGSKHSDEVLERIEWQLDHIRTSVAVIAWGVALAVCGTLIATIVSLSGP
jgi:hypothetical protein